MPRLDHIPLEDEEERRTDEEAEERDRVEWMETQGGQP